MSTLNPHGIAKCVPIKPGGRKQWEIIINVETQGTRELVFVTQGGHFRMLENMLLITNRNAYCEFTGNAHNRVLWRKSIEQIASLESGQ